MLECLESSWIAVVENYCDHRVKCLNVMPETTNVMW